MSEETNDPLANFNERMDEEQSRLDIPQQPEVDDEDGERTIAATLVQIALSQFNFVTDQDGILYVDIDEGDVRRTVTLDSEAFNNELRRRYFDVTNGNVVKSDAIKTAREYLRAAHEIRSDTIVTALRTHRLGNRIYIDLCDDQHRVVEISAGSWRIVRRVDGFRFRRTSAMKPLPEPQSGGSIDDIREIVNVQEDEDLIMVVLWLLSLLSNGPFPVLALSGPDGATKSTTTKMVGNILDPSRFPAKMVPTKDEDFILNCRQEKVQRYDNLTSLHHEAMNYICAIATGIALSKRKLYTDSDMSQVNVMAPFIINGIADLLKRRDLASRALPLRLIPPSDEKRLTDEEVDAKFSERHPKILGFLCDVAAAGLKAEPETRPQRLPRMASNAKWYLACAAEFVDGGAARLSEIMTAMDDAVAAGSLDSDNFARVFISVLRDIEDGWEGERPETFKIEEPAGVFLERLKTKADEVNAEFAAGQQPIKDGDIPRAARMLGSYLDRISTALSKAGIQVGKRAKDNRALYSFSWVEADKYDVAFNF